MWWYLYSLGLLFPKTIDQSPGLRGSGIIIKMENKNYLERYEELKEEFDELLHCDGCDDDEFDTLNNEIGKRLNKVIEKIKNLAKEIKENCCGKIFNKPHNPQVCIRNTLCPKCKEVIKLCETCNINKANLGGKDGNS